VWLVTVLAVAGKATIGEMLVSMLISGRTDHFWLLGTYDNPTTDQHKPINLQTCYGKLLRRFNKWCIMEALDISLCHITCFAEYCCECGSFPILSWTPFSGRRRGVFDWGSGTRDDKADLAEAVMCYGNQLCKGAHLVYTGKTVLHWETWIFSPILCGA